MSSAETGAVRPGNARKEAIRQNLSSLPYFFASLTVLTLMCCGQATEVKMSKLNDCSRIGSSFSHHEVICRFYHVNFTTYNSWTQFCT